MMLLKSRSSCEECPHNLNYCRTALISLFLIFSTLQVVAAQADGGLSLNRLIEAADTITEIKVIGTRKGNCAGLFQVDVTKAYLPIRPRRIVVQSPVELKAGQIYYVFLLEPESKGFDDFYTKDQADKMAQCAGQAKAFTVVSPQGVMSLNAEKKRVSVDKQLQLPVFLKAVSEKGNLWLNQSEWDRALVELVEGC